MGIRTENITSIPERLTYLIGLEETTLRCDDGHAD